MHAALRALALLAMTGTAGCGGQYSAAPAGLRPISPAFATPTPQPTGLGAGPGTGLVRHPGAVLLEGDLRLRLLGSLPFPLREALCGPAEAIWPTHPVIASLAPRDDGGPDESSEPFALTVMRAAAAGFGLDDGAARRALVDLLDRWATGDALAGLPVGEPNAYYATDRSLLPTLVAFSLVQGTPELSARQRERIMAWLGRLARMRGPAERAERRGDVTSRNNHRYLSASVSMAWGALSGDDAFFKDGIKAFDSALADMRLDGSLPLETERGSRALWYQRHAIASLVEIAEMASVQGIDLYGRERRGRSLHRAIRFLLDAIDDPGLVQPYAEANYKPGPAPAGSGQDLSFLKRRGHGRHYMAWAEIYMARFPGREESRRLEALLAAQDPDFRPMVDDYSGGDTTCLFADPALVPLPAAGNDDGAGEPPTPPEQPYVSRISESSTR